MVGNFKTATLGKLCGLGLRYEPYKQPDPVSLSKDEAVQPISYKFIILAEAILKNTPEVDKIVGLWNPTSVGDRRKAKIVNGLLVGDDKRVKYV